MSSFLLKYQKEKVKIYGDLVDLSLKGQRLTPEFLIETQIRLASVFEGVRETGDNIGVEVEIFQNYTHTPKQPYCVSFPVYVVNNGVIDSLSQSGGIHFPYVLPKVASAKALYDWADRGIIIADQTGKEISRESVITSVPRRGDIAIWRHGTTNKGHVGMVLSVNVFDKTFESLEANTNPEGSREGDGIYIRTRDLSKVKQVLKEKMWLRGFIDMHKLYHLTLVAASAFYRQGVKVVAKTEESVEPS